MNGDAVSLGKRLRSARERAGLTQQEAAMALGVSRPTLIAIEQGRRPPKRAELQLLVQTYGASLSAILRGPERRPIDVRPHLRAVAGKHSTIEGVERAIGCLEKFATNYQFLEQALGVSARTCLPDEKSIPTQGDVRQFAESVAKSERARLGLGDQPVFGLRDVLDAEVGIRVFWPALDGSIAGLYAHIPGSGYFILVNCKHPPARRRWTMAHEFGHFLCERHKPGIDYVNEGGRRPRSERFADAFAAEFLMPRSGVERAFYRSIEASGDFNVADLCRLADRYAVSLQAMSLRLEEVGLLPRGSWQELMDGKFRPEEARRELGLPKRSNLAEEHVFPASYLYLATQAYNKEKISSGQLAEMLELDIVSARDLVERQSHIEDDEHPDSAWTMELEQSLLDRDEALTE